MKTILFVTFVAFCAILSGCTGMTRAIRQLKNDNATVTLSVNSIYGTVKIIRLNPGTNSETTVTPDGSISIKRP